MQQFLKRFFHRGRRRIHGTMPSRVAGMERLESRCLLATAGISINATDLTIHHATPVALTVNWAPTGEGSADSVGLNLRVHYDSSRLVLDSVNGVYQPGLSAQQEVAESSDRDDGNADTDRLYKVLWFDAGGMWPSASPGTALITLNFTPLADFVRTVVNVDATTVSDTALPRQQLTVNQDVRPLLTGPGTPAISAQPEFTWTATTGAVEYEVWIMNLSTGQNPYLRAQVATTSFTPAAPLDLGRYRVWVDAIYSDASRSGWSNQYTFEVRTKAQLTAPVGTVQTSLPEFQWDTVAGADHYDLWVNNLTTSESQFIREPSITGTTFTPPTALPLGEYLGWVQAVNAVSFRGTWSSPVRFRVATPPSLLAPRQPTFETTPEFQWNAVAGAVRYDLWVRNTTTGVDQIIRETSLTTLSFTPASPLPMGNYLWWVQAAAATGAASEWGGGRFSIGGVPEVTAPLSNTNDTTPLITWTAVTGAVRYDLWVDRLNYGSQYIREQFLSASSFTPAAALPVATYRIWVRAVSSTGEVSAWSSPVVFAVTT
ncbi:MAG: hypothetical protein KDA96_12090 [Planctomycetaceae bacterium]|nr:hypothetical protein [Planctomycetaceae bacterium]